MIIDGVPDGRAAEGVRPPILSEKSTQQRGGDRKLRELAEGISCMGRATDAAGGTHVFLAHLAARRLSYAVGVGFSHEMSAAIDLIPATGCG
jgi:hypothetical protein